MLVREAKRIVRQWVMAEASPAPGFRGAFFHGSINDLAEAEPLPATSDVDVIVVMADPGPPDKLGKLRYQGVIVDVSCLPEEQVQSAEQVLGISHLAGSLRSGSLIADPTGRLSQLQAAVSENFVRREWVIQRCAHAREKVLRHLNGLSESEPFHDQVNHWLFGAGVTTHILLVAGLQNPTVRKRYLAVRELLSEYGRLDFYPGLLEMLGCARWGREQVAAHLEALAEAFDAARAVIRTPFSFTADISDLARPVVIDGSRELIARGNWREAVFWMAATWSRCQKVLYHDASGEMQARYSPGYRAFLSDLGIRSFADLRQRSQEIREMLPQTWQVTETIMAANPEIG